MTDHYILAARFFCVVALLLVTYLAACGVNALIDWLFRNDRGE